MKILLINNFFSPFARGGAERVVENLVEKLKKEGNKIVVVSLRPPQPLLSKEGSGEFRVSHANIYHPLNDYKHNPLVRLVWWLIMIYNPFVAWSVRRIIDKEKPDLVWTHNLYGLSFLIPRTIKRSGIKHRHTVHDIQLAYPSGMLIKGKEGKWINTFFLREWYEKLVKRLFGSPDEVVFPSKWLKGFYEERGFFDRSKRMVETNFPMPTFRITNQKSRIKNEKKGLQFLYVGQVERHKGVLFLVNAYNSSGMTGVLLNVVGSGSALEEAKRLARGNEHIMFHDQVPHGHIDQFYKEADVVVVPSLTYENSPTVIYEALNNSVPVLGSRIGGIPEFIIEGENGWLFEPDNTNDFLAKIKLIIHHYHTI